MTRRHGRFGRKFNRARTIPVQPRGSSQPDQQSPGAPGPPPKPKLPKRAPKSDLPKRAPKHPHQTWVEKHLQALQITVDDDAILVFQDGWNEVVKAGMLSSPLLPENNVVNTAVEKSLATAVNFQNDMPKSWIYYVKKATYINEQNKPKFYR